MSDAKMNDIEYLDMISKQLKDYVTDRLDKNGVCYGDEVAKELCNLLEISYNAPIKPCTFGYIKIKVRKVKDKMNNEYDETVAIIDKHSKAKSILDKWEVKLKSKLNYNNFDMAVIAKEKDIECIGCIYALRLMTQTPCSECKKSQHLYFTKENPMEWPEFKNCYNCKHIHKLVTEEPCRTCLSRDNERTCWEFNCNPCGSCCTVKSATVCHECESHHWMYYEINERWR